MTRISDVRRRRITWYTSLCRILRGTGTLQQRSRFRKDIPEVFAKDFTESGQVGHCSPTI